MYYEVGHTELLMYLLFLADYIEEPVALKFSHPCLEDHNSYCINGACAFHHELKQAICRCFTGYTGQRCEHLTLTSYAVDSYEKYIAIGIGVGLLISAFLAVFYCYIRKRCINLKSPYIICSGGSPLWDLIRHSHQAICQKPQGIQWRSLDDTKCDKLTWK